MPRVLLGNLLGSEFIMKICDSSELVLQSMGLPNKITANINKTQTSNVDQAIALDACAVSVQIKLDVTDLQKAIQTISNIVYQANKNNFPVLFMVNHSDWDTADDFNYAVRICAELGADLIKVSLPSKKEIRTQIKQISPKHPPVLLAGGSLSDNFIEYLEDAHNLGFSGVCIGRNIFQNDNPNSVISSMASIFGVYK